MNGGFRAPDARAIQLLAAAILVGPLPLVLIFGMLDPIAGLRVLYLPAIVAGIGALIAGLLLHRLLIGRAGSLPDAAARAQGMLVAILAPLALTEAAALIGAMAFSAARDAWSLVGVAAHLVLGVAIWPGRGRIETVLHPPGGE